MPGKSYKDLEVYKLAHLLAVEVHNLTMKLPSYERYEEGSQIRRSAKSIPANIVEGFGRKRYRNELLKFLVYSISSCDETKEHLELLLETSRQELHGSISDLLAKYIKLGKMLYRFSSAVARNNPR